ncbi:hypothetical protein [Cellulophaga fucicola]|uniref:hypothetical protein n=1 Tax=Cellulophaga fucicola TaxID=76595 RepID=UPI00147E5A5B|nr:hypothetical protein [Cellulophaga fucicola]
MKKLKIKNIVLESLSFILILFSIGKFQYAYRSNEYNILLNTNIDKVDKLDVGNLSDFLLESFWWKLLSLVIVFISIEIFKLWSKNKTGFLETLIAFILVFFLFPIGFFDSGNTNGVINLVGDIFSDNLKIKMLIAGVFWLTVGTVILWRTLKNTKHNNAYN